MNVVGKVSSFITQGVYSVATPFHPFGGAVDIIVVQQQDGSFRSTPWYVRFGKFQGVLKGAEKVVRIEVNGVESNFHMCLDNSGEAYFVREAVSDKDREKNGVVKDSDGLEGRREDLKIDRADEDDGRKADQFSGHEGSESGDGELQMRDERVTLGMDRLERTESDNARFYEFQDEHSSEGSSVELSEYGSSHYDNLDNVEHLLDSQTSSEVILVSVDGHILTAPITSAEKNGENVELSTPQFHLGPGEGTDFEGNADFNSGEAQWTADYLSDLNTSPGRVASEDFVVKDYDVSGSVHQLEFHEEDRELHFEEQEIKEKEYRESNVCTDTSMDNTSPRIRRGDVFKSCLELTELASQDRNAHNQEVDPSSDNCETVEKSNEESLTSPESINEAENLCLRKSDNSDGLCLSSSENPGYIPSPDLHFEVDNLQQNELESHHKGPNSSVEQNELESQSNRSNSSVAISVGHDGKQEELVDIPSAPEEVQSSEQEAAVEAECPKTENFESRTAISSEDTSDSSTSRSSQLSPIGTSIIFLQLLIFLCAIYHLSAGLEISLCRNLLRAGMGSKAAAEAFSANLISEEEYKLSAASIIKNENLVVRIRGKYLAWEKASPVILGIAAYGVDLPIEADDVIPIDNEQTPKAKEDDSGLSSTPSGRRWKLWPIPFRRVKTIEHTSSNSSNEEVFVDTDSGLLKQQQDATQSNGGGNESPHKQLVRTNVPTSDQIASLNLKEGQNMVTFIFSTRVLGVQKVDAHIYLWKWNARIVISDVDGTITKSDVLGQFMPLVGKDWTHSGIARLFSAIKENGYQLLFLSARAIVQAYLTKSFLFNLKQDGKNLPTGPVVISPDGLFPSLYREVIRRAPHEFKIACLEDIKALFPPDYNPFYAGFGNRDTDELSYRKIGIPKGKIFIINPKGEVAINHRIDVKSYTSLHTLVHDMFPPTSLVEQEDYNSWNFWKVPLPDLDEL